MQTHSKQTTCWRVASGHQATTDAAVHVLESGGNAVDAVIAAAVASCTAEPMLASLGGGVLAIVRQPGKRPLALDAFCQTPMNRSSAELDFYPIIGHFGTDSQEFHVGLASMATPGALAGLTELSRRFGRLPLTETLQPAIEVARNGVALNEIQRYTLEILQPIIRSSPECARLFGLDSTNAELPELGDTLANPDLASFLDVLGRDGPRCFYASEPANAITQASIQRGGHLRLNDFSAYQAEWRKPLRWDYRDATLWSAPPPAFGGLMLAMALGRLAQIQPTQVNSSSYKLPDLTQTVIQALNWTDRTRHQLETPDALASISQLEAKFETIRARHALVQAGTTHISVEDKTGLGVALTLSNGEGSGTIIPGTGIMMNNMLGEEDINRCGFHAWPEDRRLASMMAPTLIERGHDHWLLGSGGSNRIRSALTQVIVHLIDQNSSLRDAIDAPRLHVEAGQIAAEAPTTNTPADDRLYAGREWWQSNHPSARLWPERNLYFGGVHATSSTGAAADHRRQGAARCGDGTT